jgi:pimeloyl-ACP methyl ester carboxylesterase
MFRSYRGWPAAAIAVVAGCLSALAQSTPPQPIAPPGKLVDAGGHRLHINCTGQGSPTVVLEAGARDFSLVWALVQPHAAQSTRTCSYDRAGYAWSEAGPEPRTIAQIVLELHTLLENAGEKGPYVLVGASLGGPIVRVFANTYPKDVSGMVLVDSMHEDGMLFINNKMTRIRETSQKRDVPAPQATMKTGAESAEPLVMRSLRITTLGAGNARGKLPPDLQRVWTIARKQDKYKHATDSEFLFLPEELDRLHTETAAKPQPLGSKPLIVLTREAAFNRATDGVSAAELDGDRKSLQEKLAGLSLNSRFFVVKNSGHEIHLYQPDVVSDAIREVVQAAKTGARLKDAQEH